MADNLTPDKYLSARIEQTLTDTLADLGWRHCQKFGAPTGVHEVYDAKTGEVYTAGRAWEIWAWLHSRVDPCFEQVKMIVERLLKDISWRSHWDDPDGSGTIVLLFEACPTSDGFVVADHRGLVPTLQNFDCPFDAAFCYARMEHDYARSEAQAEARELALAARGPVEESRYRCKDCGGPCGADPICEECARG